ncbi:MULTISPECIES: hypothetical protein [unclassified Pantoea]|uniref:hypothetical protein n=1 Tax=unclassified Pantoea TaxID=2630326 RepID=UPI001232AA95|nr:MULTISPECIES: hypothetical protein [unclassified Pantoea]KAA5974844.1 hypothetical protein F3I51_02845 [Pantoea sp. M_6]KAA5979199.1 hypothetical protein F3I52_04410 [Pantoea sp. M_8]KAA5992027.1 hypothetical protein F3I47_09205 [Pantoea sp. M_10]
MNFLVKNIFYSLIFLTPLTILLAIHSLWAEKNLFEPQKYKRDKVERMKFSVDECIIKDGILYSSGWAFIDANPNEQKLFITVKDHGAFYMPQIMISNRVDVSKVFNRGESLDHSGFRFSSKIHDSNDRSFNINILRKGVLYSEEYNCQ